VSLWFRLFLALVVGYNVRVENLFSGLRAALFDLDGTLIDTHIDFALMRSESLRFARAAGVDVDGLEGLDILTIVERARQQVCERDGAEAAARFRAGAFALLEDIEVSHCANPVEVRGAGELLRRLSDRGVAVGIVTRNCRRVSERLVRDGGLAHRALRTRDDVPVTKPDPAHLLAALDAMGVGPDQAASCVMVGDHWMDAQAGRAASMRTVGLLRGRDATFFTPAPPDLLVPELADLLPLVGEGR
jgi:phosphoglycolate phosphatase